MPKIAPMSEPEWKILKDKVDAQTTDVMGLLRDYEKNDRSKIVFGYSGKFIRTEIHITDDLYLYLYQDKDGFMVRAFYVCFNDTRNVCYQRDIAKKQI